MKLSDFNLAIQIVIGSIPIIITIWIGIWNNNARLTSIEIGLNNRITSLETSINKRIDSLEVSLNKRIDDLKTFITIELTDIKSRLTELEKASRIVR